MRERILSTMKKGISLVLLAGLLQPCSPAQASGNGDKPWIGAKLFDRDAHIYVEAIAPGSAGARAGLAEGDLIVLVNGRAVRLASEVEQVLQNCSKGDRLSLLVQRDGQAQSLNLNVDWLDQKASEALTLGTKAFDAQKIQVFTKKNEIYYFVKDKYDSEYRYKGGHGEELETRFYQDGDAFDDWWVYSKLEERVSRFPECAELCAPLRDSRNALNTSIGGYGLALASMVVGLALIPISSDLGAYTVGFGTLGGILGIGLPFSLIYLANEPKNRLTSLEVISEHNRLLWKETMQKGVQAK
ncbi:MAG TPA: hypothetical protein DD435_01325 [Cyanobacteria bacterium UBA8530]|nr:hypothetical protein [Cyanobacteria bacterium UBA8530]